MNKLHLILLLSSLWLMLSQCSSDKGVETNARDESEKLFEYIESAESGINFVNEISNSEDFNIFNYRNFYNGGGVAIGDINNDGLPDLYLTANLGSNKFYLNKGDFKFEDLTEAAGVGCTDKWSTGVTMVDINADGLLDIYVCNAGYQKGKDQKNSLFINQGDLTFKEAAESYGLAENGYSTHAAFFDYDRDGDLDMYLLNNSFIPVNTLNYSNKRDLRADEWPVADFLKGGGDKLFRNDKGTFVDVSEQAGIYGSLVGFGLGVTVGDVNDDGYLDIYVSNDFFERDYLYINNKQGGFSEELITRIKHLSHSSMGADMADINNDGHLEVFVTDMLPDNDYRLKTTSTFDNINLRKLKEQNGFYNQFMHNTLQLNDGQGSFKEMAFYGGVAASDWSWGALMFDADNDSYNDLLVCNGILNDVIDQDFIDFFASEVIQEMVLSSKKGKVDSIIAQMPSVPLVNKFFRNQGALKFEDKAVEWGMDKQTFSNGAAYGDLDNDGDLDLVINNVNQPADILRNISQGNSISFKLEYVSPNAAAIGSKVKVYTAGKMLTRELIPSRGFQSSVDYNLVIGIAEAESVDSVEVRWPNGSLQIFSTVTANQLNILKYQPGEKMLIQTPEKKTIFTTVPNPFPTHKEDDFVDFYFERNIPMQLSKEGPTAAVGDYNNDGYPDVFVGAAAGVAPLLYKGSASGFTPDQTAYFEKFKAFEDTCAEFVDVDGDGDLDLLVGSGGNNVTYAKRAFRDRVYLNMNGRFEININAMPPVSYNTSCHKPFDYDKDGDLDLFVGSRSMPGEYGLSPGSYIYNNNGKGQFLDVTQQLIPELSLAGMITDALWVDLLPQTGTELVLVGEWMAPKILSFDGQKFNIIESELSTHAGWWQTLTATDIEGDGDVDLILGNMGENFYLSADTLNPLFLWINDYDDNGSIEKLITKRIDGRDLPVIVKRDLADQLPGLKKENLKHASYATKSLQDLFSIEKIKSSTIKQINTLSSKIAINNGAGDFEVKDLAPELQLSCINAIAKLDLDRDGDEDFVIGGNNNFLLPQFSSVDACEGKVVINDTGELLLSPNDESGINMAGVVRELKLIKHKEKVQILAMINSRKPILYQLSN